MKILPLPQDRKSIALFLLFSISIPLLYFGIFVIDFQFLTELVHIDASPNLPEDSISRYINLYARAILCICLTGSVTFILTLILSPKILFQRKYKKYFLFVVSAVFFSYIVIFQILKFRSFHCYADLAVPLQVLHNITTGNGPISSLEASFHGYDNWFSAHFSPIIYLVSLFFYCSPKVETIIILQTLGFALTCFPLYWYANSLFKNELASFFIAVAFLLYPSIHYAALYEFEYLKFAVPLLTYTFYFLHRKKYALFFLFLFLSLSAREDVSLVAFALGIYAVFVLKEAKTGIITSVVSFVYFVVVVFSIMPLLRGGHDAFQFGQYGYLGNGVGGILHSLFFNPILFVKSLCSPPKIISFILYTLPVCFFPFFSPALFLVALPNILSTFLTGSYAHSTIFLYHLSPAVPFIFLSGIMGINKITLFIQKKYLQDTMETVSVEPLSVKRKDVVFSCSFTLLIVAVMSHYYFGPSPLSRQFWDKNYTLVNFYTHNFHFNNYKVARHNVIAKEIITQVPKDAIISAEQSLLPHLYDRKKLYIFPDIKDDTEYVLIGKKHKVKSDVGGGGDFRDRPQFYYKQIEENTEEWKLLKEEEGVCLFMKLRLKKD